jgi:hypothetical protein
VPVGDECIPGAARLNFASTLAHERGHVYRYYLRIGDPNDLQEETVALYFENDFHIREGELLRCRYWPFQSKTLLGVRAR